LAQAEMMIDLAAIGANFRRLAALSDRAECAPVIKGDGYGHGMVACGRALWHAGARAFFVATLEDAVVLAGALTEARIAVLGGVMPGEELVFQEYRLLPVLNDAGQLALWSAAARAQGKKLPAIIHVDTGMNRLGLVGADLARLAADPGLMAGIETTLIMSHLTSSDDLDMASCAAQRVALLRHAALFPGVKLSLSNSAGSYFGEDYRLDVFRPGQAIYGINSTPGLANPVSPAMTVHAPLIQLKTIERAEAVGYSSTWRATGPTRIGTVAVGYANGYPRAASSGPAGPVAYVAIAGQRVPVVGRVSMDLLTIDVSDLPETVLSPGIDVEIVGPTVPLSHLAAASGTIERDLAIAFGHGCQRRHVSAAQSISG
jgi:alanine racemase